MKKNILIVDDFENSLFVTGFTAESAGYGIFKAKSGKLAIEILKTQTNIDLIITDYNMPEMNGLQFIKAVKAMNSSSNIPIFVLTTEGKEEIKKGAIDAGATLWIRKPFKSELLVEYIKRTIG